jgi:imidazole glycerol-phosphate synthase subunit HisF
MLKTRIIPTLLYKNFGLVKGVQFNSWRVVGSAMQAVKIFNMRGVDELAFLDITASLENRSPDLALIDEIADECFMPLAVGGGIKTVEDVRSLLAVGADKVIINTAAILDPDFIKEAANQFGSQCVVVSLDVKKADGRYQLFTYSGTKETGIDPVLFAKKAQDLGAGEILLTSIDRDGTMSGYDIELTKMVSRVVSIPVIASGGAGNREDIFTVIREGFATAAAAASIFQFTQQTPLEIKQFLDSRGINVRL